MRLLRAMMGLPTRVKRLVGGPEKGPPAPDPRSRYELCACDWLGVGTPDHQRSPFCRGDIEDGELWLC